MELGKLTGRSLVAQEGNRMLDKIRLGISKAYQEVCDTDGYVTAEKVRNAYLGLGQNHKTLLAVFKQHNEDYAKQVSKMKSERSYWKYCVVYNHLSEFIKQRYKMSDIALRELTPAFITDFELFLRTEKNHCTNTVWSYMMPFRSIIFTAINNGWLARDPFYAYHITKEETKRGFLTKDEITALINGTFKKKSYELIRDLFIFCCFTGLSWRDMYNLTEENLQTSFDGHLWIKTNRQKTGVESNIRLLDVPRHIIEKYSGMADGGQLLPVPCYPYCRYGIKAVAKLCGINKNITWHQSRHSYATTICLSNGVPIETLSKMMGHNQHPQHADLCENNRREGNGFQKEKLMLYISLRDAYERLYSYEAEHHEENKPQRGYLNTYYDEFVLRYGHLNAKQNVKLLLMDAAGRAILSLEREENGQFVKADIFERPVSFSIDEVVQANSPEEALSASLNRYGTVHIDYMRSLIDTTEEELLAALHGRVYFNPLSDGYEISDRFIAGNVIDKAERIEA